MLDAKQKAILSCVEDLSNFIDETMIPKFKAAGCSASEAESCVTKSITVLWETKSNGRSLTHNLSDEIGTSLSGETICDEQTVAEYRRVNAEFQVRAFGKSLDSE